MPATDDLEECGDYGIDEFPDDRGDIASDLSTTLADIAEDGYDQSDANCEMPWL